jgi:hypothetical protein
MSVSAPQLRKEHFVSFDSGSSPQMPCVGLAVTVLITWLGNGNAVQP